MALTRPLGRAPASATSVRQAGIDYDATVFNWMDRYVRGLDQAPVGAPVRYFVMGRNEWRDAEAWPPSATATTYYLRTLGGIGS